MTTADDRWRVFVRAEEGGAFDDLYTAFYDAMNFDATGTRRPGGGEREAIKAAYRAGVRERACELAGGPVLADGDEVVSQFFGEVGRLPGGPKLPGRTP